jgi:flagellin
MSRINTNVSSLIAQTRLTRSNAQLQTSLTRLSTGLRINSGKDDPAGLIASEALRADITSVNKAITNSERANQLIATADSALGQISGLLNDIRGLVTETANEGVLSQEQIDANQLQIDSSLEAIDRISKVTTFQGRQLLDGSLDFISNYTGGTGSNVTDLNITQANLGSTGTVSVAVDITAAATQASLTSTIPAAAAAVAGDVDITFNDTSTLNIASAVAGDDLNGVVVTFTDDSSVAANSAVAFYDAENQTLDVRANGTVTTADLETAIEAAGGGGVFDVTTGGGGVGFVDTNDNGATGTIAGGSDATTGLLDDLVVRISGSKGSEVLQFEAGASGADISNAINLLTDSTGVSASFATTTLTLTSQNYGSAESVNVEVISEGGSGTFETNLSGTRDTGTDIIATVNGYQATGTGNSLSLNTSALSINATVSNGSSTDFAFNITGGGAVFQLGPEVVRGQQARIGIGSLNTGDLGGVAGRLYELKSGNAKSLSNDATGAAEIVDQVLTKVNQTRGRLGAFQRTTLETNIASLNDTLSNLTEAQSAIRDADFASESANLTRSQILVQSGTSVLQIANQNPQNVLSLLRG